MLTLLSLIEARASPHMPRAAERVIMYVVRNSLSNPDKAAQLSALGLRAHKLYSYQALPRDEFCDCVPTAVTRLKSRVGRCLSVSCVGHPNHQGAKSLTDTTHQAQHTRDTRALYFIPSLTRTEPLTPHPDSRYATQRGHTDANTYARGGPHTGTAVTVHRERESKKSYYY